MKMIFPIILTIIIISGGIFIVTRKAPVREKAITQEAVSDETTVTDLVDGRVTADRYQPYSAETLATATEDGGTAVMFFHAEWCPFCREAEADFTANIDQLPDTITILKTDYDTSTELKKKYGVVTQHTFVQVDGQGNEISQWTGGGMAELIDNVTLH